MNQEIRKIKEKAYYHTKIKDWPEEERPREKLIKHGPQSLSDAELLALLIGSGTDGVTAVDLAKRFMVEHRSLSGLASMSIRDMVRMKGIGPARGARLLAAFEMGKRVEMGTYTKRKKIDTPEDLARTYLPQYRDLKQEVFCVILLDSGNRILQDVQISKAVYQALASPR